MTVVDRKPRVAIVGGGLVGALAACFFAKRGLSVCVYEYRADIREEDHRGQSIDLALSARGREALRAVDLEKAVVDQHGIAMRGRMLHNRDGTLKEILYDSVKGNCIYSVSRRYLNVVLLNAAEKYSEVQLLFNKKLIDADLDNGILKIYDTKSERIEEVEADLILGADGAYSTVRKMMMKRPLFNCNQTYIEHGYVELFVPADKENKYAMSGDHLHIWPRGEFMMIALPNEDYTFTGNIFAPFSTLDKLKTPQDLLDFYEKQFPDLLRLIGKQKLVKDFFDREPKTLISIKCRPYHVGKTALLVGDAAHAMVPFYAQGMNAGFEDILLLDELMDRYDSDFSKVLPMFSELRCDDAHAICDLAMYNYVEGGLPTRNCYMPDNLQMRDLVNRRSFLFRKHLDTFLHRQMPNTWIPLYSTVHFSRMKFRDCITNKQWQDKVLRMIILFMFILILAILLVPVIKVYFMKRVLF